MCDYFVHVIREPQGNDSISQALVELNKPFHSNWASFPKPISQPITSNNLFS
jgi:hypothetical protein